MNMLAAVFRELIGLFIDDGSLALAILGVVLIAGLFVFLMPGVQIAGRRHFVVWLPRRASCERAESEPALTGSSIYIPSERKAPRMVRG